jgi:CHAD domain-containing protein
MKAKKIVKLLSKRVDKVAKHCKETDVAFDQQAIHDFRVEVKRLRALLRLLQLYNTGLTLKLSRKLKRLYDVAGEIRNSQLETQKISREELMLAGYSRGLAQLLVHYKGQWRKRYKRGIIKKVRNKLAGLEYSPLTPAVITTFFNSGIEEVTVLCTKQSITDDELHTIRKRLKDLVYVARLAPKKWILSTGIMDTWPMAKMEAITSEIGDYNDERLWLEHVALFGLAAMNDQEKETIEEIVAAAQPRMKNEKKRIINTVREFVGVSEIAAPCS